MSRLVLLALFSTLLPTAAAAQTGGDWHGALTVGTDNRSKDQSKSAGRPFVGGTYQWNDASGLFYAGPSFEQIDNNGADLEVSLQAGVRPEWRGFDLNFRSEYKVRVGSNPGVDSTELEFTTDVARSIGPASARLRIQYAPDAGGATRSFTWVETRLGWAFTPRLKATTAVGRRDRQGGRDYTGWNAGLTYDLTRELQLDVRYHDTNQEHVGSGYEDRLVAVLSWDF